jgi:hypothetical protein
MSKLKIPSEFFLVECGKIECDHGFPVYTASIGLFNFCPFKGYSLQGEAMHGVFFKERCLEDEPTDPSDIEKEVLCRIVSELLIEHPIMFMDHFTHYAFNLLLSEVDIDKVKSHGYFSDLMNGSGIFEEFRIEFHEMLKRPKALKNDKASQALNHIYFKALSVLLNKINDHSTHIFK